MTMRGNNDDATRLNAVAQYMQMICEAANARLDGRGCLDVPERDLDGCCHCCRSSSGLARGDFSGSELALAVPWGPAPGGSACSTQGYTRSEERRVGKEGRSRWSA